MAERRSFINHLQWEIYLFKVKVKSSSSLYRETSVTTDALKVKLSTPGRQTKIVTAYSQIDRH